MSRRKKLLWLAPLAILGLLAFVALGGFVVKLLWNGLLPPLFGWPAVTFWQALGLLALCRILFGGFGGHGPAGPRMRARRGEHCSSMSTDERERFRERMRARWGFGNSSEEVERESSGNTAREES